MYRSFISESVYVISPFLAMLLSELRFLFRKLLMVGILLSAFEVVHGSFHVFQVLLSILLKLLCHFIAYLPHKTDRVERFFVFNRFHKLFPLVF